MSCATRKDLTAPSNRTVDVDSRDKVKVDSCIDVAVAADSGSEGHNYNFPLSVISNQN